MSEILEKPRGWVLTISTVISMLAVAGGSVLAILQWTSEATARQAEIEVRAAKEFLTTMEYANARNSYVWSEKCAEHLLSKLSIDSTQGAEGIDKFNRVLERGCVMSLPVGSATQRAEMQAIADFGIRYPFLKEAARAGLQEFIENDMAPTVASNALQRLNDHYSKK